MTSNLGVARHWANRTKAHAKSGNGNMSFDGAVVYSYATPIAHLVPGKHGHMVALVTTETYSVTTEGRHKNAVWKATGYGVEISAYHVPFLLLDCSYTGRSVANRLASTGGYSTEDQHRANLEAYAKRINAEGERIARARVDKSRDHFDRMVSERDDYIRTFGLAVAL